MLRSVDKLKGYSIRATDGEIGKVDELFFDELSWRVRYLVINVGNWLFGRRVLIAPTAVSQIDVEAERLFLSLNKELIEKSPDVNTDEPVSRENERSLHEYYQWRPYWVGGIGGPFYGGYPAVLAETHYARPAEKQEGEQTDIETDESSHLRSTAEVVGYHIQASDGGIGRVTDFLFDDEEWAIRELVVDTSNWLPGRKVLIAPPWIERIRWAERKVYVALTQESVRESPPFIPDLLDMERYERQLLEHYETWFSRFILEKELGETNMFLGKDIMGNPVITVNDGRSIGKVKDVYLTADCKSIAGIYLGTEGLFSRQSFLVDSKEVVTIGKDAVLVKHDDVIQEEDNIAETEDAWLRRDELQGRPVDTPGGTKVGNVGDVIINNDGQVLGFSLSRVYVTGPIADNHSVAIHTVHDVGDEDGSMTIDLKQAEQQELSVT